MITSMTQDEVRELRVLLPTVMPFGWQYLEDYGNVFRNWKLGLSVIVSMSREQDGKRWMHLSVAGRSRLPTWQELRDVKMWILGPDKVALQVFPREAEYVNIHPHCLHLWHCLDAEIVPDFRRDGQI